MCKEYRKLLGALLNTPKPCDKNQDTSRIPQYTQYKKDCNRPDTLEYTWVTPPHKEQRPVKLLSKDKGNMKRVMEEGSYKY